MRKFYALIGMLFLVFAVATAAPVDQEAAKAKAQAFLQKKMPGRAGLKLAPARKDLMTQAGDAYYVFNVGAEQGFVLVSGDDSAPAILGYSDRGSFDLDKCPAHVKSWLQGYADQILWQKGQMSATIAPRRITVKKTIAPLLATQWDQEAPYNQLTPKFINGAQCATGCVATAMAQLMKFYEWPDTLVADIPGYDCTTEWRNKESEIVRVHVDSIYAGLSFDWANMLPTYYGLESEEETQAVAVLSMATGASVQMDYADTNNGGSAAANARVPEALKTYFDYSKSATYVQREDYMMDEWNDLLYKELEAGRPVLMGGTSSEGGHSFIVDGYDCDEYFHINWGWGGYADGYYLLSATNPYTDTDGYTSSQDAVIGILPNYGIELPLLASPMVTQLVGVEGVEVTANYYNRLDETNVFNIGLGYVAEDGTIVPIKGIYTTDSVGTNLGYTEVKFAVYGLEEGTYKVLPIAKLEQDSVWYSSTNPRQSYVEAVVTAEETKLTLITPTVGLSASMPEMEEGVVGKTMYLDVEITNNGDEYYGLLMIAGIENKENAEPFVAALQGVTLLAGTTQTVTFCFTPEKAGEYMLALTADGDSILGAMQVKVNDAVVGKAAIAVTGIDFNGAVESKPYPVVYGQLNGEITVKNVTDFDFDSYIFVVAQHYSATTGTVLDQEYYVQTLAVPANDSVSVPFDYPLAENNQIHLIAVLANDGKTVLGQSIVTQRTGVMAYSFDGVKVGLQPVDTLQVDPSVFALEFQEDSTIVRAVEGANPNILFFFGQEAKVPESLTKNVVLGNESKLVELTDSFSFASPRPFLAEEIRYTRSFEKGLKANGEGWETIYLPFGVQKVESKGAEADTEVQWFDGTNPGEADFWLLKFADEVGEDIIFDLAESMDAQVPYLIGVPEEQVDSIAAMENRTLVFSATDAIVPAGADAYLTGLNFRMCGVAEGQTAYAYLLNETGTDFVLAQGTVVPFRAYFIQTELAFEETEKAHISVGNSLLTAIAGTKGASTEEAAEWYLLDGRRVQRLAQAGVYVRGGKKVVVK